MQNSSSFQEVLEEERNTNTALQTHNHNQIYWPPLCIQTRNLIPVQLCFQCTKYTKYNKIGINRIKIENLQINMGFKELLQSFPGAL